MARRLWRLSLATLLLSVAPSTAAVEEHQKPIVVDSSHSVGDNPFTEELAKLARDKLDEWKVPGVSIAVVDGDDIYAKGYGFATLPDVPATPQTIWYGASTTKAQTAAVLAGLIHSNNYSALLQGWSTPISSIIRDDFVLQDEWATDHVTLEDAVSHRTGMAEHDKSSLRVSNGKTVTPKDIVRNLRNLPLDFEPRVTFAYCNLMFVALSHVIETVTGRWLGDSLKELIWGPLGMNSTYFDLQDAIDAPNHLASGYYWDTKDKKHKEVAFMPVTEISGAGAVFSNVVDYAKWAKCLLHQSEPFSPEVHADIRTPRMLYTTSPGPGVDVKLYGLGWGRTLHYGHVLYTHSGGMHAYGAEVFWLPGANFSVVSFGNTAMSNAVQVALAWKLIDDKLGIPEADRVDFSLQYAGLVGKEVRDYENAVDILYPDRPDPVLPSTLAASELVGTYYEAGYGNITLHEAPHPDRPDEKILVADRPETTWRYSMRFHHVSGEYWIVYLTSVLYAGFEEFVAGEFKIGADGKVSGLEIAWTTQVKGKTLFKHGN